MYKTILLAVDMAHDGSWAKSLPVAVEYARTFGSTLHLVTVVPSFGMSIVGSFFPEDYETQALTRAGDDLKAFAAGNIPDGVTCKTHVALGRSYEEILEAAEAVSADLIVVGSHQPGTENYLLGSTASRVVRFARTSVLVVRE